MTNLTLRTMTTLTTVGEGETMRDLPLMSGTRPEVTERTLRTRLTLMVLAASAAMRQLARSRPGLQGRGWFRPSLSGPLCHLRFRSSSLPRRQSLPGLLLGTHRQHGLRRAGPMGFLAARGQSAERCQRCPLEGPMRRKLRAGLRASGTWMPVLRARRRRLGRAKMLRPRVGSPKRRPSQPRSPVPSPAVAAEVSAASLQALAPARRHGLRQQRSFSPHRLALCSLKPQRQVRRLRPAAL
mmetsp:Transcript_51256/g.83139  ORF Transcript_51256/g.83139 Transcript_51256/m.83139 type:complete len:240 (-) Transcript_51256:643-1362(-)